MWLFVSSGCIAPATPIPSTHTPGVGVPVSAGNWEVTIKNIRQPDNWSGNQPKSGYAFLVIDATFQNLDKSQETKVMNDAVAIIENEGQITRPAGWGIPDNSNIDMIEIGDSKKDPTALGVTGGMGFVPSFSSKENTLTATYVFIFTEDFITNPLKFQFQDVHIPITLSK
jgi:hypothetical protein